VTEVTGFLDGLRRQQQKYRELAVVAEEQKKVLGAGDIDTLMGVVERKRAIMDEIEGLERELAPVKGRWAELRADLDAPAIREVEEAVEETKRILQELVRLEDEARLALDAHRATTAEQLKDLMKKKKARGAYGGSSGSGPRFMDGQK